MCWLPSATLPIMRDGKGGSSVHTGPGKREVVAGPGGSSCRPEPRPRVCPGLSSVRSWTLITCCPFQGSLVYLFMVRHSHSTVLKLALNSRPPFPCLSQVLGFQSWPVHRLLSNSSGQGPESICEPDPTSCALTLRWQRSQVVSLQLGFKVSRMPL